MAKKTPETGASKSNTRSDWTDDDHALIEDRVPAEWIEILNHHAGDVRRVRVEAKRGSGSYFSIPHGQWTGACLDPSEPAKTESEAAEVDPNEPASWAVDLAAEVWQFVVDYARSDGPNIDSRIILEAFDPKRGAFVPIKGATIAARCHTQPRGGEESDIDPQADFFRIQNTAIRDRDREIINLSREVTRASKANSEMAAALQRTAIAQIDLAEKIGERMQTIMSSSREDVRAEREWITQLLRTDEIGRTVRHAVSEIAPELRGFAEGWSGKKAVTIQEIAAKLRGSITTKQQKAIADAGLADVFAEILSGLEGISAAADHAAAVAVVHKIGPIIAAKQGELRPHLTDQQAGDVFQILKLADLV